MEYELEIKGEAKAALRALAKTFAARLAFASTACSKTSAAT